MPISLMSARLFENAFRTGDFTGWPDWIMMDDGAFTTSLMLSVVGTERNCYSVVVKTDDPGSQRFVFLLNVEQMNERLKHLNNRFPIKDVLLMEKDETGRDLGSRKRMAVQIDYGEHFVLDVVERPAMRAFDPSSAAFSAEGDGTEEEEETPEIEGQTFYRVQVGAFSKKTNAENYLKTMKALGFNDAYVTNVTQANGSVLYKVQIGSFSKYANAEALKEKLAKQNISCFIAKVIIKK